MTMGLGTADGKNGDGPRFGQGNLLLGPSALLIAREPSQATIEQVFGPVVDGWTPWNGDEDDEPWYDGMPWRDPDGPYALHDGEPAERLLLALQGAGGADGVPGWLPSVTGMDGGGLARYDDGMPAGVGRERAATGKYLSDVRAMLGRMPPGMRLWYLEGEPWQ